MKRARLLSRHAWGLRVGLVLAVSLSACSAMSSKTGDDAGSVKIFAGDESKPRNIFVFLDGTRNDPASRTNVRKLFDRVVGAGDPQTTAIYIEGVGTAATSVFGQLLGLGMESRILRGYDFIARSAAGPQDNIYIFGFSRGAHQARALAGMIAYAGLPKDPGGDPDARHRRANAILEIVKRKSDRVYLEAWRKWEPGTKPFAADELRQTLNVDTVPVRIAFLGLWDTVPGSSFKDFGECMEKDDRRTGDRYKSGSYPPIRRIVHAVALDEKRSKFHQLLICPGMNGKFTSTNEVWFPGAHADIGGGYEDAHDLSDLSLRWMTRMLGESYAAMPPAEEVVGDPAGTAHWSIGDWPAAGCDP
jgi:uncharacterized protein (DUF2235 family)